MNNNCFSLVNNELYKIEADILVFLTDWEVNTYSNAFERIDTYPRRIPAPMHMKPIGTEFDKAALFDKISIEIREGCKCYTQWYIVKAPVDCKRICLKTELLAQCYKRCLKKALESGVRSIMIDLFATGNKGYNPLQAYFIAREAINETMQQHRKMTINLNVEDKNIFSQLNRFETFLRFVNVEDAKSDINKTLKLLEAFDCEEKKLTLSIKGLESYCAVAARERNEMHSDSYPQMLKEEYNKQMIAETLNKWLCADNDEYSGGKYARKTRSASLLAREIDADPSTVSRLANGNGSIPSREMLISLAIGMGLDKEQRLNFILYGDESRIYPSNIKEQIIENILNNENEKHDYHSVNAKVNEKLGETIRKTVERKEKTTNKKKTSAKKKEKEK